LGSADSHVRVVDWPPRWERPSPAKLASQQSMSAPSMASAVLAPLGWTWEQDQAPAASRRHRRSQNSRHQARLLLKTWRSKGRVRSWFPGSRARGIPKGPSEFAQLAVTGQVSFLTEVAADQQTGRAAMT